MTASEQNRSPWTWTAKKEQAALMLANGEKWDAVLRDVAISSSTLAAWKKAPEFQARIDEHLDVIVSEARQILRRGATQAARQIVDMIRYGNPMHTVKLKAAQDVLDRVGLKPVAKQEVTGANGQPLTIEYVYVDATDDPEASAS